MREHLGSGVIEVPVTHAKIFGWYDNEYGSYTNLLGRSQRPRPPLARVMERHNLSVLLLDDALAADRGEAPALGGAM